MIRWQQLRDWASHALSRPSGQAPAQPGSPPTQPSGDDSPRHGFVYHTLLVPLDGSPLAECALPFARRLAALSGARLLLVRAVAAGEPEAARDAAMTYLEAHADVLRETGVRVDTIVPVGAAVEAIAATVADERVDLIIMTTSGRFLLGHGASGLFAGLLARVAAPILLVRAWHDVAALETTAEHGGARIVVPLDGSAMAEQALDSAQAFAALLGGELVLVRAVPAAQPDLPTPWGPTAPDWVAGRAAHAEAYLRDVAAVLAEHGVTAHCEVRPGGPVAAIHGAVHEHEATLLALATHGESALAAMPLGSVARQVLWEADAPVVLVHPALTAGPGEGTDPASSKVSAAALSLRQRRRGEIACLHEQPLPHRTRGTFACSSAPG